MLAHLLSVGPQDDTVADHVLEGRAVEERRGHDVHGVEPATGLTNVLHHEIAGVPVLEVLLVLEGVVELGEGHGPRFEPAVQHVRNPVHGRLAGRVVRIGPGQLVYPGSVHVDLTLVIGRVAAEVPLELLQGAVDIHPGVLGVVRDPDRYGRTPESVARDGPVAGVGQPLTELAVLDVFRNPVDLLVEFQETILDLGHGDEPAGHRLVDQRCAATPAVGIGMDIAFLLEEYGPVFGGNPGQRAVPGA